MTIHRDDLTKYILVVLLIYLSGNVYFRNFNYDSSVILVFTYTVFLFFHKKTKNKSILHLRSLILLCVFAILMCLTVLFNNDESITSYIAIYLQIAMAMMATKIISTTLFKKIYIQIIVFLAVTSLFFHFIGLVYPNIVLLFPRTDAIVSANYHNALIHVYQTLVGYGEMVFHKRNAGIFWEPGAYQAFLNLGLIFILEEVRTSFELEKKRKKSLILLIVTIISTYSTTGFIILTLILIYYSKEIIKMFRVRKVSDLFLVFSSSLFFVFYLSGEIQAAMTLISSKYIIGSQSWIQRISLDKLRLLSDTQSLLFGISFENYFHSSSTIWNSIIQTMVVFGVPFTFLILYKYFVSSYLFSKKRILFFVVLLIIFSTENLFWRPFFLYFAFANSSKVNVRRKRLNN